VLRKGLVVQARVAGQESAGLDKRDHNQGCPGKRRLGKQSAGFSVRASSEKRVLSSKSSRVSCIPRIIMSDKGTLARERFLSGNTAAEANAAARTKHLESVFVSSGSFAWGDLLITFVICWRPPLAAPETLMQRPSIYPSPPHPTRRRLDWIYPRLTALPPFRPPQFLTISWLLIHME